MRSYWLYAGSARRLATVWRRRHPLKQLYNGGGLLRDTQGVAFAQFYVSKKEQFIDFDTRNEHRSCHTKI